MRAKLSALFAQLSLSGQRNFVASVIARMISQHVALTFSPSQLYRLSSKIAQGRSMAKKAKHSKAEIAAKLAQADNLATQGKLQSEIARTLGVSVMTLHRWRKLPAMPAGSNGSSQIQPQTRIAELQLENSRLRRLVTDLLLEKIKSEEALQVGEPSTRRKHAVRTVVRRV
jgi:putative transposase